MLVDGGGSFGYFEIFLDFEHRVGFKRFLDLRLEVEGR